MRVMHATHCPIATYGKVWRRNQQGQDAADESTDDVRCFSSLFSSRHITRCLSQSVSAVTGRDAALADCSCW